MTSKYTPGPWHMFNDFSPNGVQVAGCHASTGSLADVAHCHGFDANRSTDEVEANARLITAAPDLLAALQRVVAEAPADALDDWYANAQAVIAQATERPAVPDPSA